MLGLFLLIARAIHVTGMSLHVTAVPSSQVVDGSPIGISLEKELANCMENEFNKSMFSPEVMKEMCQEIYNYIADQLVLDLGNQWGDLNLSHGY